MELHITLFFLSVFKKTSHLMAWNEIKWKKVLLTSENWILWHKEKVAVQIDQCEMSRQTTDCRVNTQLLFGLHCTLRLHDSLHVLLTQCTLWRRDSLLSLAVHSLHSGGEIRTTDSGESVGTLYEPSFNDMSPDYKFDNLRKLILPPPLLSHNNNFTLTVILAYSDIIRL